MAILFLLTLALCGIGYIFARANKRANYEEVVGGRLARYAGSNRNLR
jgi:hypothetical protein